MQRKHLATESQMFDSSFFKNIFRDANNISASRFFWRRQYFLSWRTT